MTCHESDTDIGVVLDLGTSDVALTYVLISHSEVCTELVAHTRFTDTDILAALYLKTFSNPFLISASHIGKRCRDKCCLHGEPTRHLC